MSTQNTPPDNTERPLDSNNLSLYALAAHAAGDWPLQTNHMATQKFDDPKVRAEHVAVYTLSFLPIAIASNWDTKGKIVFLVTIAGSHYAIDSRRWVENFESFPTRAVWFDQAFHIIALGIAFALSNWTSVNTDYPLSESKPKL